MKNNLTLIKIMFGSSILFVILFAAFYIWGIDNCHSIYELLDHTLPFFIMDILSVLGFGISIHKYYKNMASAKDKLPRLGKAGNIKNYEKRYIVKTYGRDGVHVKHISIRGDYGMLKSA